MEFKRGFSLIWSFIGQQWFEILKMGFYLIEIIFGRKRKELREMKWALLLGNKPKIFGIGLNETGTTSFIKAIPGLGFRVGDYFNALKLFGNYQKREYADI